jgi:hypothetical protein
MNGYEAVPDDDSSRLRKLGSIQSWHTYTMCQYRRSVQKIFEVVEPFLDFGARSVTLPRRHADVAKSAYAQELKSAWSAGKANPDADSQESDSATFAHVTGDIGYQSFSFSDVCATLRHMPKVTGGTDSKSPSTDSKRGAVVEQADTRDLKSLGPKDHSGSTPDSATNKPRKSLATSSLIGPSPCYVATNI